LAIMADIIKRFTPSEGGSSRMRNHPLLYEINTFAWLNTLSHRYGRGITLHNVPDEVLDTIAADHFDVVWLMGIWERSPDARDIARSHEGLRNDYAHALPGFTEDDIIGSPYAIHRYAVDSRIGGRDGLAAFREALRRRGMALILDYVPNHVANDHHWIHDHPDALLGGTDEDMLESPGHFYRARSGRIVAHGRDPYFPPWGDTAQVNAFSPAGRAVTREALIEIAKQCDGVRCDMAMLLVNRIFAMTWGLNDHHQNEFWREVIPAVKTAFPNFLFMAEVYWDMEHELQRLGFDYTYDKRLYDRLLHEGTALVRDHLMASYKYQARMVRFLENHDEPRALTAFGEKRIAAAAVLTLTLPGMKLIYEGQLEGRRVKLPVQLGRAPDEPLEAWLRDMYRSLLAEVNHPIYHDGVFMLLAAHPNPNESESVVHGAVIAYAWAYQEHWRLIVVNRADHAVRARVMLPQPSFRGSGQWHLSDALDDNHTKVVSGDDMLTAGIGVDLAPNSAHIYHMEQK